MRIRASWSPLITWGRLIGFPFCVVGSTPSFIVSSTPYFIVGSTLSFVVGSRACFSPHPRLSTVDRYYEKAMQKRSVLMDYLWRFLSPELASYPPRRLLAFQPSGFPAYWPSSFLAFFLIRQTFSLDALTPSCKGVDHRSKKQGHTQGLTHSRMHSCTHSHTHLRPLPRTHTPAYSQYMYQTHSYKGHKLS